MPTFYLIRHGDKHPFPPDPGLTSHGHEQAKKTAEYISTLPIEKVLSSPLRRTLETARYIAEVLNLPVETDPRLRERINWGDDPTQTREDFIQLWIKTNHDRNFAPPVGISSRRAGQNFLQVLSDHSSAPEKHIAVISHGGIISDFLRNMFPESALIEILKEFPNGLDYEISECSVTEIAFGDGLELRQINSVEHLV